MPIKKFVAGGTPTQGYPADGELLAADLEILTQQYQVSDDVTHLVLGAACNMLHDRVAQTLAALRKRIVKLDDSVTDGDVKLHMGKLKKVERIMQKAVHYAVCSDKQSATPKLASVCDILRGTIELPAGLLQVEGIGSRLIDTVNQAFDGQVIQVKNRFIESMYPNIADYTGRTMSPELKNDIITLVKQGLWGRDTFYRDIQLLVKLGSDAWETASGLDHVLLEIQLVSSQLYGAKSTPSDNGMSGHDQYKVVRAIMEHCEYHHFTDGGKNNPPLKNAFTYYPPPSAKYWESFTGSLLSMWELYRKASPGFQKNLQPAIDDSDWYKNTAKNVKK